jgi:nitric oxide reductase NorD protein
VSLELIESASTGASRDLHRTMNQRDALRPLFHAAWNELAQHFQSAELEAWSASVLDLVHVNAGATCLIAFWDLSRTESKQKKIASLVIAAEGVADICRSAGAEAAIGALQTFPVVGRLLGADLSSARWWAAMRTLASKEPDAISPITQHMTEILSSGSVEAFENFIAAGLRASAGNKARRLSFFSLQDELARRLVIRGANDVTFASVEAELKAFVTALWGKPPLLRPLSPDGAQGPPRRTSIAGPVIRLPEVFRGVDGVAARNLFRAAAAHAQAHLVFERYPFDVGSLKPLQIVLVNLIEDARIETLAMRELPGLRRLWMPFHVAEPSGIVTAPHLLARLARALFDPAYHDDEGFVAKGREMFLRAVPHLHDPAISRQIGMLLGNDLGQMRIQFNAKTHIVEPVYRDDGLGLWDFKNATPSPGETIDIPIDAARIEQKEANDSDRAAGAPDKSNTTERARPVAPDDQGVMLARYPEWDRENSVERPEWATVREVQPQRGDHRLIEAAVDQAHMLRGRVRQLIRGITIGRQVRLNRQHDGHDLDLNALLDAGIALRLYEQPDPRIFRASAAAHRDLSALLMIDVSESTADRLPSGTTVLDVERLAVAVLAEAMDRLGDPFGLLAFASDGRSNVQMTTIKSFDEPYSCDCAARLSGLQSGLSTRLGAALRHAGKVIGETKSGRKLVIVLTDGEPSDVDTDTLDLVEDARRAAVGLHAAGIDVYGVVLGTAGITSAARIFGRGKTMMVHRIDDLPRRLSELYFRLARR